MKKQFGARWGPSRPMHDRLLATVAALLPWAALGACSAPEDGETLETAVTTDGVGTTGGNSDRWDRDAQLERAAERVPDGYDLPEVGLVRYIRPDESAEVLHECMLEQGFPGEIQGSGVKFALTTGQEGAFALANYICKGKCPVAEIYMLPLDADQWQAVYTFRQESTAPCLEELGYTVPEPPSPDVFVASEGDWDPLSEVERQVAGDIAQGRRESFDEVAATCPSSPPLDELFPPSTG